MASIEMYIFSVDVVLIAHNAWHGYFGSACISEAYQFQLQGQPIFNNYIILFEIQSHLCGACESRVNFTLYFFYEVHVSMICYGHIFTFDLIFSGSTMPVGPTFSEQYFY